MNFLKGINESVGKNISWIIIVMVVVQIIIVLARYVFGIGFIKLQELMIYMHGMLFTLASGYTLLHDEHVRVDVIYRESSLRYKSYINFFGSIFLLLPFIYILIKTSLPYVQRSWRILEGSPVTSGLNAIYILKTVLIIFPLLLLIQVIVLLIDSIKIIRKNHGRSS
ncbi:MAG: TRAP transporter small permease subunit [Pseudomonadota bacterium]|nr:TRAP transporter small permease subunit [Pseudomonadota bacterium]